KQVEAVATKLKDLNPGFLGRIGTIANGEIEYRIEGDKVVEFKIPTDQVADISPVRALPSLRVLECRPADVWNGSGKLTDLWALRGLPLTYLACGGNAAINDLSPLIGMPLRALYFQRTTVADLKPVKNMRLLVLACQRTPVSDLSPL